MVILMMMVVVTTTYDYHEIEKPRGGTGIRTLPVHNYYGPTYLYHFDPNHDPEELKSVIEELYSEPWQDEYVHPEQGPKKPKFVHPATYRQFTH